MIFKNENEKLIVLSNKYIYFIFYLNDKLAS